MFNHGRESHMTSKAKLAKTKSKPAKKKPKSSSKKFRIVVVLDSSGRAISVTINGIQIEPPKGTLPPAFSTRCHDNGDGTCFKKVFDATGTEVYSYTTTTPCPSAATCPRF